MPNTNLRTDQYIKGSKKITKDMAGESKYFQMAPTIKVSGEMILLMAEAFSCNLMEVNMRDSFGEKSASVMVGTSQGMGRSCMRGSFKMISSMGLGLKLRLESTSIREDLSIL